MFDRMVDYILKEGEAFDRVIFDTAAVANAVRLIGLSKIYGLWLTRMIDSRKEALSMRVQLSFRKEKVMEEVKKDPLMADLISMNERFEQAKGVLVDPERTAFFFVTLPLALPIAVVRRFIGMVQKFNIPIGGVIVNEVLRPEIALQEGAGEYLANKYHEQTAYMKVLYRDLGPLVRSYIPLYSSEVTGVDMVRRVSEDMTRPAHSGRPTSASSGPSCTRCFTCATGVTRRSVSSTCVSCTAEPRNCSRACSLRSRERVAIKRSSGPPTRESSRFLGRRPPARRTPRPRFLAAFQRSHGGQRWALMRQGRRSRGFVARSVRRPMRREGRGHRSKGSTNQISRDSL